MIPVLPGFPEQESQRCRSMHISEHPEVQWRPFNMAVFCNGKHCISKLAVTQFDYRNGWYTYVHQRMPCSSELLLQGDCAFLAGAQIITATSFLTPGPWWHTGEYWNQPHPDAEINGMPSRSTLTKRVNTGRTEKCNKMAPVLTMQCFLP